MNSFNESFWGEDLCSTDGFDAVYTQLHNGRQHCKSVEDFLKQRSKIEEDYGKALLRLSHSSPVQYNLDESSLLASWRVLRQQTEELANSHLKLSRAFGEQQMRLAKLMFEQKHYRKSVEDEIRKLQANKRDAFRKMIELKKNYHKRCKEADLHDKLTSCTMVLKEKEKMQTKQFKLLAMAESADKSYADSVESLNMVINEWEQKMNDYLHKAEEMETNRIICVRNEMWECSNFVCIACVYDDECCEKVRKSLEGCSEVRDLRDFVLQHNTGSKKPACVLKFPKPLVIENIVFIAQLVQKHYLQYENYYLSAGGGEV